MQPSSGQDELDPRRAFYHRALVTLNKSKVPFLVGGAFALKRYTGIARQWAKDFDLFVYPRDCKRVLEYSAQPVAKPSLRFHTGLERPFVERTILTSSSARGTAYAE